MGVLDVILNRGSFIEIFSSIISAAIVVFLVMPVHEYAHGFVAEKLGDPTPRWQGRMSLNPIKHIDYVGAVMIFLVGFGWAKPVQVDSRYFKNEKRGMALTALAGPVSNLIVATIVAFVLQLVTFILFKTEFYIEYYGTYIYQFVSIIELILLYITLINVSLAVFNLIPIPPLDGSKILYAILPDRIYWKIMQYERYLYIGLLILIFAGSGFGSALSNITGNVTEFILYVTSLPFELFV